MINKYIGDSIRWETVIKDRNGTALNAESPVLSVNDATGSNVANGTGSLSSSGTYFHQDNITSGWGTGPVSYRWNVIGVNGTALDVMTNEINVLAGTVEPTSYIYESELESYYTNIIDYSTEHTQNKLTSVYHKINRRLEAQNIKAPRSKNPDGFHDQSLRDWNAWWGIYFMIQDWEGNRPNDVEGKPWYQKYWDEGEQIYEDIKKRKIVFRDQISASEVGIGKPSRIAGSSIGTMENNWDNSYGKGFQGSDFERIWTVEVLGTGASGGINEASMIWSKDGGMTTQGTITSSYDWIALGDEVFVRFTRGTSSGTVNLFMVGDKWQFETQPIARAIRGARTAISY